MKHNILLAFSFAKRDFKDRYFGTGLGQFWYIIHPLIMIFIYTVIFSDFMKMKLDIVDNSYAYSIYLVPAILSWITFSGLINRLSNSIEQKAGLIKKINVPMYTFQISIIITEFLVFCLSILLGVAFLVIVDHPVTLTFLWLLPVMILQILFAFGVGVIISLFAPFIKDIKVAVPIIIQLWFWMTPIIYMKEMVIDKYPSLLTYNPMFYFMETYHNIFLYAKAPEVSHLIILFVVTSLALFVAGYLYKKMISTIKDII